MSILGPWATGSGREAKMKKKVKGHMRIRGECVSVLGQWATRLRKRGKKNEKKSRDV